MRHILISIADIEEKIKALKSLGNLLDTQDEQEIRFLNMFRDRLLLVGKQISLTEEDIEAKAKENRDLYRKETKIDGLEAICYSDGYQKALKDLL